MGIGSLDCIFNLLIAPCQRFDEVELSRQRN